jgi:hypothetical protein
MKMTSMYDVLRASKGLPVDDIFAELWGRKLSSDYTIDVYTGTLPATLSNTKAGYLHRYKIYGNVGENFYDKNNASMNFIGYINTNGTVIASSSGSFSIIVPVEPNTTYTIVKPATSRFRVGLFTSYPHIQDDATAMYGDRDRPGTDYGTSLTFTTSNDTSYILAFIRNYDDAGTTNEQMKNSTMVLKGSITPESYIPYGECGERTENLFDYRREFDGQTTDATYFRYYLLQLQPNTSYTIYSNAPSSTTPNETSFIITADEDPFNTATGGIWENQAFTLMTKNSGLVKVGLRRLKGGASSTIPILTENDFATGKYWLNLVKGSTVSSTYAPFGYKLPLTSGNTPVDIYIGDDTLSTEEYIDSGTGKIYRMVSGVLTPTDPPVPFPQIPTSANSTTVSWAGEGLAPSEVEFEYERRR